MIGRPIAEILGEPERAVLERFAAGARKDGERGPAASTERSYRSRDGRTIPVLFSASAIEEVPGRAGGYVESHYTWLIRTFWIGLLYSIIGAALSLVFAFLTQVLLANQVATGLALTLFGLGFASLMGQGYNGIKTGTTEAAGACLVSFGQHQDNELVVVVLGSSSSDARYADTRNLFRWAWQQTAAIRQER